MNEHLGEDALRAALLALGRRRATRTELIIGGAGALILTGELVRATSDCDVLFSTPDMGQLQDDIRAIAEQLGISSGWLNGSVQSYLEILPPDFRARLRSVSTTGSLRVAVLDRRDIIVMKLYAGRPRDLTDVAALKPTPDELQFARSQIPRLNSIDAARATRMAQFLDFHDSPTR